MQCMHFTERLILCCSLCIHCFILQTVRSTQSDFLFVIVNMGHSNGLLMFWVDSLWCNMKSVIFMQLNSDSIVSIVTLYRLDSLGFKFLRQQPRDVLFSKTVQTSSGAHPVSCLVGTLFLSWEIKWAGCEADRSPPSSTEVKSEYSILILPVCVFMTWIGATLPLYVIWLWSSRCLCYVGKRTCVSW